MESMRARKTALFVLSQQPLFRQGLELVLSTVGDMEVVGSTHAHEGMLSTIQATLPDVIIADIDDPAMNGFSSIRELKRHQSSVGVIALTSDPNDARVVEALKSQTAALLSKETDTERLVATVRRVASGDHPINDALTANPTVAAEVLRQFRELSRGIEAERLVSPLTSGEMEILRHIAEGYGNKQIASELDLSEQTIKNHVTSILRKLNANARMEAVVRVVKQGIRSLN